MTDNLHIDDYRLTINHKYIIIMNRIVYVAVLKLRVIGNDLLFYKPAYDCWVHYLDTHRLLFLGILELHFDLIFLTVLFSDKAMGELDFRFLMLIWMIGVNKGDIFALTNLNVLSMVLLDSLSKNLLHVLFFMTT